MDMVLALWLVCLASPVLAWVFLRLRPRLKRKPRQIHRPAERRDFLPRLSRDQASLERLVNDLSRLERDFARVDASDPPNKMQRLQAISLAYDDVLCECCAMLDLPHPASRPLGPVDRLQTECDLARHGLTW